MLAAVLDEREGLPMGQGASPVWGVPSPACPGGAVVGPMPPPAAWKPKELITLNALRSVLDTS